jgi:glucose-1-phosphate thymidylyltransferase
MPGGVFHDLHHLWRARQRQDEYFGTLVNAYLAAGGAATAVKSGTAYVDVGTLHGYRAAIGLLADAASGGHPLGDDAHVSIGWPAMLALERQHADETRQ